MIATHESPGPTLPMITGRPRLMIADDDPLVRSVVSAQMSERFELVGVAADAQAAIVLARAQRPDAAILDLQMPAGGGLHATREIHLHVPHTAIIILSVDEQHDSVVELLEAGAISYTLKGTTGDFLIERLLLSIAAHCARGERT